MAVFKKVKTLKYNSTAVAGVISVQYDPIVNQLAPNIDGAGVPSPAGIESDAQSGTLTIRDKAEAEKIASKHEATANNITFETEDGNDAVYTVTLTGCTTTAASGTRWALGGSGPWQVQFIAQSASEPVANS